MIWHPTNDLHSIAGRNPNKSAAARSAAETDFGNAYQRTPRPLSSPSNSAPPRHFSIAAVAVNEHSPCALHVSRERLQAVNDDNEAYSSEERGGHKAELAVIKSSLLSFLYKMVLDVLLLARIAALTGVAIVLVFPCHSDWDLVHILLQVPLAIQTSALFL